MASRRAKGRLAKLWQMPLLVVSLGLFGYAAYLFINPKFGLTTVEQIEIADALLKNGRFEPALDQGNKLLLSGKLKPAQAAHIHLLLAAALDGAQKTQHISLPSNHKRIVDQTRLALIGGESPTTEIFRRLGQSQEAIDHPLEAVECYRKAIALDAAKAPDLQRKVIEMQLAEEDSQEVETSIDDYLKMPKLAPFDRAWALTKKAQALASRGTYEEAKELLAEAMRLNPDPLPPRVGVAWLSVPTGARPAERKQSVAMGTEQYWLGYCEWKLGHRDEAERLLRVSRDRLTVAESLDANAAYVLGRIRQEKKDASEAIAFYLDVLRSHPESTPALLARLRRGLGRIALGDDDAGLSDVHTVVAELAKKTNGELYKSEAVEIIRQASAALSAKANLVGAIEAMEAEQSLVPEPPPEYFGRLAAIFERRATQVAQAEPAPPTPAEKESREAQVRKIRVQAADAYIALSRGLTLADDQGRGDAMWKGVDLYDQAGAVPQSIAAMETFIADRPDDSSTPDAMLRLGRAFHAIGRFDKAIKAFQRLQFRYPQSLASSKSGVPLAQSFIAKGPDFYKTAESVLQSVLDNPIITPAAEEFRMALFEMAQLYYRTDRYEDAIGRLEETTQRYPKDARMGQLLFLMADSYRKSALKLDEKLAKAALKPASANPAEGAAAAAAIAEAAAARVDRLNKAKNLFGRIVDLAHTSPPTSDLDKLYLKLSHFYRADCFYDLAQYEEAIRLYDAATLRYQDDPSAPAAYVQIVNAYCRLGRFDDAHTANERAKWLLRKMPASAFEDSKFSMPKSYWEDWLRQTSQSGIYSKDLKETPVSDAR